MMIEQRSSRDGTGQGDSGRYGVNVHRLHAVLDEPEALDGVCSHCRRPARVVDLATQWLVPDTTCPSEVTAVRYCPRCVAQRPAGPVGSLDLMSLGEHVTAVLPVSPFQPGRLALKLCGVASPE